MAATTDQAAAIGAFLSGVASVISGFWYVKRERKRLDAECEKRIADIDRALHEGIRIAHDEHDDPSPGQ